MFVKGSIDSDKTTGQRSCWQPPLDSLLEVKDFLVVLALDFQGMGSIPLMILGRAISAHARPLGSSSG